MDKIPLKDTYKQLYDEVAAILFRHDPIGLNAGDNLDEYEPETRTILPRLKEANSETDVHEIIYEEFLRWFSASIVGHKNSQPYKAAAKEIWAGWIKFSRPLT